MKKGFFRRQRRLSLSALVLSGLFCASAASAATLVTTIATDYNDGQMGVINGSHMYDLNEPPQEGLLQNLGGDASVFNFHQNGVSKLLVKYNAGGTTSYHLFNPYDFGNPTAKGKISSVVNPHAVAATDKFIYVTGYDFGKIGILREDGGALNEQTSAAVDLKNDIKQYAGYQFTETYKDLDKGTTQNGNPSAAKVHGEALLIDGKNLYAAV